MQTCHWPKFSADALSSAKPLGPPPLPLPPPATPLPAPLASDGECREVLLCRRIVGRRDTKDVLCLKLEETWLTSASHTGHRGWTTGVRFPVAGGNFFSSPPRPDRAAVHPVSLVTILTELSQLNWQSPHQLHLFVTLDGVDRFQPWLCVFWKFSDKLWVCLVGEANCFEASIYTVKHTKMRDLNLWSLFYRGLKLQGHTGIDSHYWRVMFVTFIALWEMCFGSSCSTPVSCKNIRVCTPM
jgi:hypothetical protein